MEYGHIRGKSSYDLPDLLFFSGKHSLRIHLFIRIAPSFFVQELQTAVICFAGNQLFNHSIGKKRQFQGTYPGNCIYIIICHISTFPFLIFLYQKLMHLICQIFSLCMKYRLKGTILFHSSINQNKSSIDLHRFLR